MANKKHKPVTEANETDKPSSKAGKSKKLAGKEKRPERNAASIVSVDDLRFDNENPNAHTKRGGRIVEQSFSTYGAGRSVVADRNGQLIAGNKAVETWKKLGNKKVRVVQTRGDELVVVQRMDLDASEGSDSEKTARGLGIMDNTSAIADIKLDPKVIVAQMERLDLKPAEIGISPAKIAAMQEKVEIEEEEMGDENEGFERASKRGIFALREDAVFPSTNEWQIPDLMEDSLCEDVPSGSWDGDVKTLVGSAGARLMYLWGKTKYDERMNGGFVGFYLDDYKFEHVFTNAIKFGLQLQETEWTGVVAPDFSVFPSMPLIVQMWSIYRSRWCARYWQEIGIPIIPSLMCGQERTWKFCHHTLPKNCPVVSVQVRTDTRTDAGRQGFMKGFKAAMDIVKPKHCIIYGGPDHKDWMTRKEIGGKTKMHFIDSWSTVRRQKGIASLPT